MPTTDRARDGVEGESVAELLEGRYAVNTTYLLATEITEVIEPGGPFNPKTWIEIPCWVGPDDPDTRR